MNERANIVYTGVADRNARLAFEQVSREIVALKKGLVNAGSPAAASAAVSREVGVSSVDAAVTEVSLTESPEGVMFLTFKYEGTGIVSATYATLFTIDECFPAVETAGSMFLIDEYFGDSKTLSCAVFPDGSVKAGINVVSIVDPVFVGTIIWKWR